MTANKISREIKVSCVYEPILLKFALEVLNALLLIALTHYCTSLPDFGWLRHVGEGFFSPFFQSSFAVCRFVDHKSSVKFDRKRMVRPLLKSAFPYTCRPDFAAKNAIVFSNSK